MIRFKQWLCEYELSDDLVQPSTHKEHDIDHSKYDRHELGKVGKFSVTHYSTKGKGASHTFVKDEHGGTIGTIEHKKPTVAGRLAISNITRDKTDSKGNKIEHKGLMSDVLHHMVKQGHSLESDNTNTLSGAHPMLMKLARSEGVHTHIENGKGDVIHHEGDVTSKENQAKYTIHQSHPEFLDNEVHKHVLVFNRKG